MNNRFIAVVAVTLVAGPLFAGHPNAVDPKAEAFVQLFLTTCVAHETNAEGLKRDMALRGFRVLADPRPFLLGGQGIAWPVNAAGGQFVVSLRSDDTCAVFARMANDVSVKKLWSHAIRNLAVSDTDRIIKGDDKVKNTAQGPTEYITYRQMRKGARHELYFALTTASSPAASPRALATFSVVAAPERGSAHGHR